MVRLVRIGRGLIEINNGVEVAFHPNPGINRLAISLVAGRRMIVVRAGVGQDRRSHHLDVCGVGAGDDLLVRSQDALNEYFVHGGGRVAEASEAADIIHAFEQNDPADTSLREHIAIETRQGVGSEAIRSR